ncbi:single-stranded DNA-binding protein [Allocoleopsis sp.]|uniref:single-stranded DNA-binding protein n=1 Tax=Allocoleopsis sp. TaxID=3088169 RepID=UPI002FD225C4
MNSCILMAQIIQDPELRYTADNQTPIAQMLVEFPSQRAEDPPTRLRVVGWGNLANSIKENYSAGDRVLIEGRLGMNTIERPEGFKEKRAELTAARIYKLGADTLFEPHVAVPATTNDAPASVSSPKSNNVVVPLRSPRQSAPMSNTSELDRDYASSATDQSYETPSIRTTTTTAPDSQQDLDDIPF